MTEKFDILRSLLEADRTVRRFDQAERVELELLHALVGLTRYCASGRNAQPLAYRCVVSPEECAAVFPHLRWAGYYTEWAGPAEGERPAAYLVQCVDTRLAAPGAVLADDGLQLQAITLGATAQGLGCCIIKAFVADEVARALAIPEVYKPRYVVAIGRPAEAVRLAPIGADGDFRYYHDPSDGVHTVPKRPLAELLIG